MPSGTETLHRFLEVVREIMMRRQRANMEAMPPYAIIEEVRRRIEGGKAPILEHGTEELEEELTKLTVELASLLRDKG